MNNVLLIGSGGRESAIIMSIISSQIKMLYAFENFANKGSVIMSGDAIASCITRLKDFCKNRTNIQENSSEFFANLLKNQNQHLLDGYLNPDFIVDNLYCIPANPQIAKFCNIVNISTSNDSIVNFCKKNDIKFVIIGPEDPLADGLVDELEKIGIKAFGPSKLASQIESSKIFMKDFCTEFKIPTAKYATFYSDKNSKDEIILFAQDLLNTGSTQIVLKTNGLAAGKGVIICQNLDEFKTNLDSYFNGKFGTASQSIVVEEFMQGTEVSFFALCDGTHFKTIGYACDHKKLLDGNQGPNTGGMGTYSYKEILTNQQISEVEQNIIKPLVMGMFAKNHPYRGVIFAGLMLTKQGIRLIEYNARFGDPETQAILPLLNNNIMELLYAATTSVKTLNIDLQNAACINVVCVSGGYPDEYKKGIEIQIDSKNVITSPFVEELNKDKQQIKTSILGLLKNEIANLFKNKNKNNQNLAQVIHCGTAINNKCNLVTNGGRVISVCAKAKTIIQARNIVYNAIKSIKFDGMFYRKDI